MRSLRIAYIFALTFLLSITIALGIVAFYESPKAPKYPKYPGSAFGGSQPFTKEQEDQYRLEQQLYDSEIKEYEGKSQVHSRNQFIISLFIGVLLVLGGAGISSISTAVATGVVLAGAITFTFGQMLLLTANIGSIIARYTSSGRDTTGDLLLQCLVALLGTSVLLVIGFWRFRDKPIGIHHREHADQSPFPSSEQ